VIRTDVTLAVCTYNDARLTDGLLAHVRDWTVRPARIVVVDDGSEPPYSFAPPPAGASPDRAAPQGLEILRNPRNTGINAARTRAVEAADSPLVLSMDSDVRLAPDWLERMLPVLEADPGLGMAATPCPQADGPGLGTRYMHANALLGVPTGPVHVLDGCLWLLRKRAWDQVGGLHGHDHFSMDDHELSRRLRGAGWRLLRADGPEARQVRLFSRLGAVRRLMHWQLALAAWPHSRMRLPERLRRVLRRAAARVLFFLRKDDPALAYVELLHVAGLFLGAMRRGIEDPRLAADTAGEFCGLLHAHLREHPAAWNLLRADLTALGCDVPRLPRPNLRTWNRVTGLLLALRRHGLHDWLQHGGADAVRAQDAFGAMTPGAPGASNATGATGATIAPDAPQAPASDAAHLPNADFSFYDREPTRPQRFPTPGLDARDANGETDARRAPLVRTEAGPPRVLVVADIPGWALERKADNICARLQGPYHMTTVLHPELTAAHLDGADLILLFFWEQWRTLRHLDAAFARNRHKLLAGVTVDMEISGARRDTGLAFFDAMCRAVFCVNGQLVAAVRGHVSVPVFTTPNGVDTRFFTPAPEDAAAPDQAPRPLPPVRSLRAGWSGSLTNHGPVRRVAEILKPGVALANGWELDLAARENRWRTMAEMRDWYRTLDAYVCVSAAEGAPNPNLEASACSVPLLSTPVGDMPAFVRHGVNGFLVDPDPRDVAARLERLGADRELRRAMGRAARKRAEEWDWDVKARAYRALLDAQFADPPRG
jgi:glycosyltransferase involved in cell wall biosynthesis